MIPYKDDNPTSIFPYATIGIIVLNVLVFSLQLSAHSGMKEITYAYGAIPQYLLTL